MHSLRQLRYKTYPRCSISSFQYFSALLAPTLITNLQPFSSRGNQERTALLPVADVVATVVNNLSPPVSVEWFAMSWSTSMQSILNPIYYFMVENRLGSEFGRVEASPIIKRRRNKKNYNKNKIRTQMAERTDEVQKTDNLQSPTTHRVQESSNFLFA